MSIIDKIKALLALNRAYNSIEKEITMETASGKPGWKTTEFWGKVGAQAMLLWSSVAGFLPPKYSAVIGVSLEALYQVCRTVAKAVSDVQATKQATPASDATTVVSVDTGAK